MGDEQKVGVDDSISAMTAIFLLPDWAPAPIRGVICSTGGHTCFVRSVDPFLSDSDVSFTSDIGLPVSKTGNRNQQQFVCGQTAGNAMGDKQEVGTTIRFPPLPPYFYFRFRLQLPSERPKHHLMAAIYILRTLSHPFLSDFDVSFASEIRLPVVCLRFSHLISSLVNHVQYLSPYLLQFFNTSVDNRRDLNLIKHRHLLIFVSARYKLIEHLW